MNTRQYMFQLNIANTCFNEVSLQSALGKFMHENIRPGSLKS